MSPQKDAFSPQNILRLARSHIRLYETRIAQGRSDKNINLQESQDMLRLWKKIEVKHGEWNSLTHAEQQEIKDAIAETL